MADRVKPYQFEPKRRDFEAQSTINSVPEGDTRTGNIDWCRCGNCVVMPTEEESVCCTEGRTWNKVLQRRRSKEKCIVELAGFSSVCLDNDVLETAYLQYRQEHGPLEKTIEEKLRYTAYRQLIRWCYGKLGYKIRVPVPACAVNCIRQTFTSDAYRGFSFAEID